jgi:hypothetical protein
MLSYFIGAFIGGLLTRAYYTRPQSQKVSIDKSVKTSHGVCLQTVDSEIKNTGAWTVFSETAFENEYLYGLELRSKGQSVFHVLHDSDPFIMHAGCKYIVVGHELYKFVKDI